MGALYCDLGSLIEDMLDLTCDDAKDLAGKFFAPTECFDDGWPALLEPCAEKWRVLLVFMAYLHGQPDPSG